MIIKALAQYGRGLDTTRLGYATDYVPYALIIAEDGQSAVVEPLDKVKMDWPAANRTNGIYALPAGDSLEYVLGLPRHPEPNDKTPERHQVFLDLMREWVDESADPYGAIALRFLESQPDAEALIAPLSLAEGKRKEVHSKRLAIRVVGDPAVDETKWLHLRASTVSKWQASLAEVPASRQEDLLPCVACGILTPRIKSMPSQLKKGVPRGLSTGVALLSANFAAANRTRDGGQKLASGICPECADGALNAMRSLSADKSSNHATRQGEDYVNRTIWWRNSGGPLSNMDLLFGGTSKTTSSEDIAAFIRAVRYGGAKEVSTDRFRSLRFHGNSSRLVFEDWIDEPLAEVDESVAKWLEDTENSHTRFRYPGIIRMATAAGPYRISLTGRDVSPGLRGAEETLWTSALRGRNARNLLGPALVQCVKDALITEDDQNRYHLRDRRLARESLLRLLVNQARRARKQTPMKSSFDLEERSLAYALGHAFHLMTTIQAQALDTRRPPMLARYCTKASTAPVSIYPALFEKTEKHLASLPEDKHPWSRRNELAATIARAYAAGIPATFSPAERAEWWLGYYHAVSETEKRIAAHASKKNDNQEPEAA